MDFCSYFDLPTPRSNTPLSSFERQTARAPELASSSMDVCLDVSAINPKKRDRTVFEADIDNSASLRLSEETSDKDFLKKAAFRQLFCHRGRSSLRTSTFVVSCKFRSSPKKRFKNLAK